MISDSAREMAEQLLDNWGEWCRDDWQKKLGYAVPPTSRDYRAPIQHVTRARPVIIVEDAELANEAILDIGLNPGYFDLFNLIVCRWAHGYSPSRLERKFKCTGRTIRRRTVRAKDLFWTEYRSILLRKEKKLA
jgi:hypothetical protein